MGGPMQFGKSSAKVYIASETGILLHLGHSHLPVRQHGQEGAVVYLGDLLAHEPGKQERGGLSRGKCKKFSKSLFRSCF